MEFHVLGPLEVLVAGEAVALGGAKQRALLAALLLSADEVVSVERLIDEVWGDRAPPSAGHSLEAYVSRIRQCLNGHGPTLVRRGAGYMLVLGEAVLDARVFAERLDEATHAAAEGDSARAARSVTDALALWRGPALADVALASAGRAEAERLEELRLRAYELRFDAELALGHHEQVVGALQSLVAQNPYRERYVSQLMLALYRSGRHAEALEAYEQTRKRLDDDLGLQPSAELQQLSGQIVRQEPELRRPHAGQGALPATLHDPVRRTRRLAALVTAGTVIAATMALTASGSTARHVTAVPGESSPTRVALALSPMAGSIAAVNRARWTKQGFRDSALAWDYDAKILTAGTAAEFARDISRGDYSMVVVGDDRAARAIAPLVPRLPSTQFAFVGLPLTSLGLEGVPNATGMTYADEQAAELAGYLSGLVPIRRGAPGERADVVSVVVGERSKQAARTVSGFTRGVRRSRPTADVLVAYAPSRGDKAACERLANRQIDAGADVVFAFGQPCGESALAVARVRSVWGIGEEAVAGELGGPHMLATTVRRWEQASATAFYRFEVDLLPHGEDAVMGLNDDYAVIIETEDDVVSERIWSKVAELCSRIRQASALADYH